VPLAADAMKKREFESKREKQKRTNDGRIEKKR
jgi:hypothetical protein